MYKPPENCNRVKTILSKFESIDNNEKSIKTNRQINNNLNPNKLINNSNNNNNNIDRGGGGNSDADNNNKLKISRQLSDPIKKNNIKRTPAFRLDKNLEKYNFQKNQQHNRNNYFETKIKRYNSALKNCDNNTNNNNNNNKTEEEFNDNDKVVELNHNKNQQQQRPVLIKSKSSHDFALIRSKFDKPSNINSNNNNNKQIVDDIEVIKQQKVDLSLLYTEPIPKSLRCYNNNDNDNKQLYTNIIENRKDNAIISNKDKDKSLTDTLKSVLKRPLPRGPAPKKPPRTFEHDRKIDKLSLIEKNQSFLHPPPLPPTSPSTTKTTINKDLGKSTIKSNSLKKDPRYMLNKLEDALRNNRIKTKKSIKTALTTTTTTTSGEDSDDSLLFRSKSKNDKDLCGNHLNFNCLNNINSIKTTYETIKEPNSRFFVKCIDDDDDDDDDDDSDEEDEHVYDEPCHYHHNSDKEDFYKKNNRIAVASLRNSLHYMSTSLLGDEDEKPHLIMASNRTKQNDEIDPEAHKQISTSENSSLSSFTSDLDSTTSTPLDEHKTMETSLKIKKIINAFETNKISTSDNNKVTNIQKNTSTLYNNNNSNNNNRVEDLKMSLQKTLDRCFNGNNVNKDTNNDSDGNKNNNNEQKVSVDDMVNKFQMYVKTMPKYKKSKINKDDRLFYCCLIVGWNLDTPQIKFKFPSNVEIPQKIEDLCFPEASNGPLDKSNNAQCYSLVITNDRGERTFGYCRRVIPEGSTNCLPLAYCILSKHRAPRFYKKILTELETRHGLPDKLRDELIDQFYCNKFPKPGESIKINLTNIINEFDNNVKCEKRTSTNDLDLTSFVHVNRTGEYGTLNKINRKLPTNHDSIVLHNNDDVCSNCIPSVISVNGDKTELVLTLHHDTRYEEADLKQLHDLPNHILLKVFASLLLERKVILISCVISKLSCCVEALQSILYPFSWPHTFIPILPKCLWDVVESPTPVVCGVLSVAVVNNYSIEHGIVVDLDERSILIKEGDEDSILSNSMKKAWEQGINLANTIPREDYVHSVYLSDAYIKLFTTCMKNYKNFIVDGDFQKETFIRNGKTRGIRRFLKWFTESTMFGSFIDTVINNSHSYSLFDQKMEMYGSEDSNLILNKLLEWKK